MDGSAHLIAHWAAPAGLVLWVRFEPRTGPLCQWCEFNERCPGTPLRDPQLATWEEALPAPAPKPKPKPAHREASPGPSHAEDPGQLSLPLGGGR